MPGPEKVRYSHQAMADLILANPAISQNELAGHFGYTPGWVSQIVNSDAFQAFLATRKEELVNPVITASVEEKLMTLAKKSLDVLHEKLATEPKADTALKSLEVSTRALGYGAKADREVNFNFVVALPQKAESNAAWLEQKRQIIDALPLPMPAND